MQPNIATATNTRIDSGAKHVLPCKVATTYFLTHCKAAPNSNVSDLLIKNKNDYAVHKDDLVIGITNHPLTDEPLFHTPAYAACISTLGNSEAEREQTVERLRFASVCATQKAQSPTTEEWNKWVARKLKAMKDTANKDEKDTTQWPGFYFLGVALTTAYAHASSGDTVCSVMVSGLRTIRNGPFPINTNDTLQWIWAAEHFKYKEDGAQELDDNKQRTNMDRSKKNNKRVFAAMNQGGYEQPYTRGKTSIAVIKPFKMRLGYDDAEAVNCVYDYSRIFGRAMSNAGPYEMVDVLISAQSM